MTLVLVVGQIYPSTPLLLPLLPLLPELPPLCC